MKIFREYQPIARTLNIILAEDDSADRILFEDALEELPVTTNLTSVGNGDELIQWLTDHVTNLPDVLFLDLNMPRKNGFASLGEIKRNPVLQDLPVFIFTTANNEEMIKQVYKDAAHYFIPKPIEFNELKSLIYKALLLVSEKNISLPNKENFILKVNEV